MINKKIKIILISALIGLILLLPLFIAVSTLEVSICKKSSLVFNIDNTCNKIFSAIYNVLFPLAKSITIGHPEGGLILIYLLPLQGIFVGAAIGFIIASGNRILVNKKLMWKRWEFFVSVLILLFFVNLAIIPILKPVAGDREIIGESKIIKYMCIMQGCSYNEFKHCTNDEMEYPTISIDELPKDTIFNCNAPTTRQELENGKCVFVNDMGKKQYYDPFLYYDGFSVSNGNIYIEYSQPAEKRLCSRIGEIKYKISCKC